MSGLFGFTARFIKPFNETVYESDYDLLRTILQEKYKITISSWVYEMDKQRQFQIHCHGTIQIPPNVFRKTMIEYINSKDYHFFIRHIFDLNGWNDYINKTQKEYHIKLENDLFNIIKPTPLN